ncbi:putative aldo/keto reductase [Polychaeton citri CBS 116435]|uniref:Aldo/keto reductase n=1 Tax=Polychaeton citri CBS 116435 TaxID=1314669 RepID=A0A9P4QHX0_9PEZI|nr:putative aldo/keto reductase [Polychaeton citri CBS 116435]
MTPQIIFGDIAGIPDKDLPDLAIALKDAGITRLDTAARYGGAPHASEKRSGAAGLPKQFTIDSKVLWDSPQSGPHSAEKVAQSVSESLASLGVEKVNVLYLHGPDDATPLAEQVRAIDAVYKQGKFNKFGVSNFDAAMLQECLDIATRENLVKPSVFQGQFNLVCRAWGDEVFPILRSNNMHFNAYSPLAGGFLLGNFTTNGHSGGNRFSDESPSGALYKRWFDKPSLHEAVKKLRTISEESGIAMADLSLRWLTYHSILGEGDGIILGASKISQVERNARQIRDGPLPEDVAQRLNALKRADGIWSSEVQGLE